MLLRALVISAAAVAALTAPEPGHQVVPVHEREARLLRPVPPSPWPRRDAEQVMERARPRHLKATALTVAVVAALRFAVADDARAAAWCRRLAVDAAPDRAARVVGFAVAACAYAVECARSSTRRYVADARSAADVDAFLRAVVAAAPVVAWRAERVRRRPPPRAARRGARARARRVAAVLSRAGATTT